MSKEANDPRASFLATNIVISHATEDYPTAVALADALVHESLKTWLAKRDVPIGSNWPEEITRAISGADFLVVLLSPESITSPHVRREVNMAISKGVTLLPVLLNSRSNVLETLPDDWSYWLSVVQIVNFTDERSTASQIAQQVRKRMPEAKQPKAVPVIHSPEKAVKPKSTFSSPKVEEPLASREGAFETKNPMKTVASAHYLNARISKSRVNIFIFFGAFISIGLLVIIFVISSRGSKVETPSSSDSTASSSNINSPKPATSPKPGLTSVSSTNASRLAVSSPKVSSSVTAKPSATSSASPKVSSSVTAKPSATSSTSPKVSSSVTAKPSQSSSRSSTSNPPKTAKTLAVSAFTLKELAIAAVKNLQDCVSKTGIAPPGCPFREKTWVQASDVTWSLQGSPHLSNAKKIDSRFVATVVFTVVDKASYGKMVTHTKTQTITTQAVFSRSAGEYTVTWK